MGCRMRPLQVLMSVEEAMQRLMAEIRPIDETEEVPLEHACGRVVARDVCARMDVPPFDRAAMDGYAVLAASTVAATPESPVRLQCIEVLYAGSIGHRKVDARTCSEIATGAPLPLGADAVVMVEHTGKGAEQRIRGDRRAADGESIEILHSVRSGQHVMRRGTDIRQGETVLAAGTYLTPARVGAAAAVGIRNLAVYRRPRVKIGATGDEVVEPGQPVAPGQIYNVNSYSLYALFTSLGCDVEMLALCPDDVETVKERIRGALGADLIVLSGGSSVGEKDILQDAFASLGEIVFHGIAIKPGKPTMLARIEGKPVVGMPGYPTSCLSNGYLFLAPAIDKMARRPPSPRASRKATLADSIASVPDKFQLFTVRLQNDKAAAAFKESGAISSMSHADGFVTIPVGVNRLEAGQEVEVTLL